MDFPLAPFLFTEGSRTSVSTPFHLGLEIRKDRCPQDPSLTWVSEQTLWVSSTWDMAAMCHGPQA